MKLLSFVVICLHLQKDTFYFEACITENLFIKTICLPYSLLQVCLYYLRTVLFVLESITTCIVAMFVMYHYHGNASSFQFAWCVHGCDKEGRRWRGGPGGGEVSLPAPVPRTVM